jgi:uncharacterized protein YegL
MEKKKCVYNLIILDESGSMESIKPMILSGFNELVQTISSVEKEHNSQEHFVSFVTFNSSGIRTLYNCEPASTIKQIDAKQYNPNYTTPLFDAMGIAINDLKKKINPNADYRVLVSILTDGEENASKEYNRKNINFLVNTLKLEGWTFTYIGADHDVDFMAKEIGISDTQQWDKNSPGISIMINNEKSARIKYYNKLFTVYEKDNTGFYEK